MKRTDNRLFGKPSVLGGVPASECHPVFWLHASPGLSFRLLRHRTVRDIVLTSVRMECPLASIYGSSQPCPRGRAIDGSPVRHVGGQKSMSACLRGVSLPPGMHGPEGGGRIRQGTSVSMLVLPADDELCNQQRCRAPFRLGILVCSANWVSRWVPAIRAVYVHRGRCSPVRGRTRPVQNTSRRGIWRLEGTASAPSALRIGGHAPLERCLSASSFIVGRDYVRKRQQIISQTPRAHR